MKVDELIAQLQKCNQKADVILETNDKYGYPAHVGRAEQACLEYVIIIGEDMPEEATRASEGA